MDTRQLFFLRDRKTDQYYNGQNDCRGSFNHASIYTSEKNAKLGRVRVIKALKHSTKYIDAWINLASHEQEKHAYSIMKKQLFQLALLENWGVELVPVVVTT